MASALRWGVMTDSKYVILVGADYSPASDLALQSALEFAASKTHVELHVVNVRPTTFYSARSLDIDPQTPTLQEATATLNAYVAVQVTVYQDQNPAAPFAKLFTHLREDEAGPQIAQLAADLEADLVVVGTHRRHGFERLLLGSVAEVVMRLSPCPVLVVRPKAIPAPVPTIEPPCPRCVEARFASQGAELWCEQHRERHGQRHTYHQGDRVGAATNFPLVTSTGR